MSKHKDYKRIRPEEFLRYISGEMSDRERHEFERIMQRDLFASEAMEGLSGAGAGDIREDLSKLERRLERRTRKRPSAVWIRIAASVTIVLALGTLYFTVFTDRFGKVERMVADSENAESAREEEMPQEQATGPMEAEESRTEPDKVEAGKGEEPGSEKKTGEEDKTAAGRIEPSGPANQPKTSGPAVIPDEELTVSRFTGDEELLEAEIEVADEEIAAEQPAGTMDTGANRILSPPSDVRSDLARTASLAAGNKEGTTGIMQVQESIMPDQETTVTLAEKSEAMQEIPEVLQQRQLERRKQAAGPPAVTVHDSIPAAPMGGWEIFNRYIESSIRIPQGDSLPSAGTVALRFFLDAEGHPRDIYVERSPGEVYSSEAIRLLREGPAWTPVYKNGVPSEEPIPLRIEFRRR